MFGFPKKESKTMSEGERQLRGKRRNKIIEALETFLHEDQESPYGICTYSEVLLLIEAKARTELERIESKLI